MLRCSSRLAENVCFISGICCNILKTKGFIILLVIFFSSTLLGRTNVYADSESKSNNQKEVLFIDDFEGSKSVIPNFVNKKEVTEVTIDGWEELIFPKIKNHTKYSIFEENFEVSSRLGSNKIANHCLKAVSSNSASGLYKAVSVDLKQYPFINWRWKVNGSVAGGNVAKKSGDDYSARIYVTFAYDRESLSFPDKVKHKIAKALYGNVPSRAVSYIWANKAKVGSAHLNAYTDKAAMFVKQSGNSNAGLWMSEKANVFEDFKEIFNIEPSLVESVVVMTDTDNTHGSAKACYDDIYFTKE